MHVVHHTVKNILQVQLEFHQDQRKFLINIFVKHKFSSRAPYINLYKEPG